MPEMIASPENRKSLREVIRERARPLPSAEIVRIGIALTDALLDDERQRDASQGIVSGELTTENIFLTGSGDVVIAPGTTGEPKAPAALEPHSGATQAQSARPDWEIPPEYRRPLGAEHGRFSGLSPEQALGEAPDARSALFALGAVLYELACGEPAFTGADEATLFQEILTRTPAPPLQRNPELWPRLAELILWLLEKDRDLRCQSAADVRAELRRMERDYRRRQDITPESPGVEPGTGSVAAAAQPASCPNYAYADGMPADQAPTDQTPAESGINGTARKSNLWRRPALLLPALVLLALGVALGLLRAAAAPEYAHCLEFSGFAENGPAAGGSRAPVAGFILSQTLGQFPDVRVVTPEEFARLHRVTSLSNSLSGAVATEKRPSLLQRLNPWGRGAPEPAGRVHGTVSALPGGGDGLALRLDCVIRGRKKVIHAQFQTTDEFLRRGADALTRQIINLWTAGSDQSGASGMLANYRPATQLLSAQWDAIGHYFRGARAWEHLNINVATTELRQALTLDPDLAAAHLALGEVRIFQNQWDAAQSEILAARRRAVMLPEADQERVEAFLARVFGKPRDERRHFHRVIELQPQKKENYYELAESYFHTADADEAITHYQQALELDPDYARAWNHLAYGYSWQGAHDRAIAAGEKYLQLDGSANAYDSLGDAYTQAGDYEKARAMKLRALELDPDIHYATRTLAFIDLLHGRFADAESKLQSLLKVTSDNTQVAQYYADLGFLYYRAGRLDKAATMCMLGFQRLSDQGQYDVPHDELLWLSGLIAVKRYDLPAARAALRQLRTILEVGGISAENYKPAYKYRLHLDAALAVAEGKNAEAVSRVNDLKFISDKLGYWSTPYDYAFFMDAAGVLYEKMNMGRQAEDSFREALFYNRNFPDAALHLADYLLRQSARDEARALIGHFNELWQDQAGIFPETATARRLTAALEN